MFPMLPQPSNGRQELGTMANRPECPGPVGVPQTYQVSAVPGSPLPWNVCQDHQTSAGCPVAASWSQRCWIMVPAPPLPSWGNSRPRLGHSFLCNTGAMTMATSKTGEWVRGMMKQQEIGEQEILSWTGQTQRWPRDRLMLRVTTWDLVPPPSAGRES